MNNLDLSNYPKFNDKGPTACSQYDPDLFFPEPDGPNFYGLLRSAKEVCYTCPYQLECLQAAVANNEPGVWGGTSELERRKMLRNGRVAIPLTIVYSGGTREKQK
jgi:WhiB family redox-sensing transcriptional regulator